MDEHNADPREWVKEHYGKTLRSTDDLQTNACCAAGAAPERLREPLEHVHPDIQARFYGCGFPIPVGVNGRTVMDLGCGTGRDVFLLSQLVGPRGQVHGVDMSDEQLALPRELESWHVERFGFDCANTHFHTAYIEDLSTLPLQPETFDVVVSNCVVNLSPRKDLVLQQVHRMLKPGGEFHLSDVLVDRRLPEQVVTDPLLYAECLGGSMYHYDFEQLAKASGFLDPRVLSRVPISIQNPDVSRRVGEARFESVTYRLFKLPALEPSDEDYGQTALYTGGMDGAEQAFVLDHRNSFAQDERVRVSGNTADIVSETRFAPYFRVEGTKGEHLGAFQPVPASEPAGCCQ